MFDVTSTTVILDTGLNDWLQRMRKWDDKKRRKPKVVTLFPLSRIQTLNFCCSLNHARDNKPNIYSSNLFLLAKKHLFTSYPAAKHQNTANLCLQTYVDFSSRNNFASISSFAEVSVAVESIIPWLQLFVFDGVACKLTKGIQSLKTEKRFLFSKFTKWQHSNQNNCLSETDSYSQCFTLSIH